MGTIFVLIFQWRKLTRRRLSNLSKVTQLIVAELRVTLGMWPQRLLCSMEKHVLVNLL